MDTNQKITGTSMSHPESVNGLTKSGIKDDVPTLGEALNEAREYLDRHAKYGQQTDEPVVEVSSETIDY